MSKKLNNKNVSKLYDFSEADRKKLRFEMNSVSCLLDERRKLIKKAEYENNSVNPEKLRLAKRDYAYILKTHQMMEDGFKKIIIQIDVINPKDHSKYYQYMSRSQYYRHKYSAYYEFKCALN